MPRRPCRSALSPALLLLLLALPAAPAAPVVPGYERLAGDPARAGRMLVSELGCLACHAPANPAATRKQAPVLDQLGGRARLAAIRAFLRDPQAAKPGTTMPHLLHADPERDAKVEALVQFLATTGSVTPERPLPRAVAQGRDLYGKVGCVACHGTRKTDGSPDLVLSSSVPLGNLAAKYTIGSLAAFLDNPLHVRPTGRMPKLLNAGEAKDVASFLLQSVQLPAGGKGSTRFAYYEGDFGDRLPDFSKLIPKASGVAAAFDLGQARRDGQYALKFDGVVSLPRDGEYTFGVASDDGARLTVDGRLVVDNDGIHPKTAKDGRIKLTGGVHAVSVTFFQGGGEAELEVTIRGPGVGSRPLNELIAESAEALKKQPVLPPVEADLTPRPELAAKGKALFASLGCAGCHALRIDGTAIESTVQAPALERLSGGKGCLAERVPAGLPRYGLSAAQTRAAAAALVAAPPPSTPASLIDETMIKLNCYACHVRSKTGGPAEELTKAFQTTQPEMGDEGRLPPPLDGVGAKLQPDYFRQLLDKGGHDRPYMHTRMPGFGLANVSGLPEAFAALDRLPATAEATFKEAPARVKATARHLVGAAAFGCIKCHTFAGKKAEGVQGIDMVLLPRRVRRDWFHAYIADPQKVRPGTRMPAAFINGKSVLPDYFDGTALTQIEAIWQYLGDGPKAQTPAGMGQAFLPLTPTGGAIVYRNFIEGAGTRAIGVGYPEKVNLAFDANDLRLALLWHGGFIDAARHWTDRGSGFEGPLGDNVLKLPAGAPFARLSSDDAAWPATPAKAQGYRFRGYRLTSDDRPTFLYTLGDIAVEDFAAPFAVGKEMALRRTFTLTAGQAPGSLVYRAAVGNKIESLADGSYRVDDVWTTRLPGAAARLRKVNGRVELLVPVRWQGQRAVLTQEYAW